MLKRKIFLTLSSLAIVSALGFSLSSCNEEKPSEVVEQKFDITVASVSGAKVTVDKETAVAGEAVTITVSEVTEGKMVSEVKVNDMGLALTTNNKYTFNMPAKDVTVTVTLADIPVEATYKVDVSKVDSKVTVTPNKAEAHAGDTIELDVKLLDTNFEIKSVFAGNFNIGLDSNNKYSFVMPANDVVIQVNLEEIVPVVVETFDVILPTEESPLYEITCDDLYEHEAGDVVSFDIVKNFTYTDIVEVKANDIVLTYTTSNTETNTFTYTFTMPKSDVTITVNAIEDPTLKTYQLVDGEAEGTSGYSVKYAVATSVYESPTEYITSAIPGQEIDIWVTGAGTDATRTPDRLRIEVGEGDSRRVEWLDLGDERYNSIESKYCKVYKGYVMPVGNVKTTISLTDVKYDITYRSNDAYEFFDMEEAAEEGDTVSLRPVAYKGYYITGVKVTNDDTKEEIEVTYNESSNYYSFRMPASEVTIEALFESNKVQVGIKTDAHASISNLRIGSSSNDPMTDKVFGQNTDDDLAVLIPGDEYFYFDVVVDEGFVMQSLTILDSLGEEVNYSESGSAYYLREIPEGSFTIEVKTIAEIATVSSVKVVDKEGNDITSNLTITYYNTDTPIEGVGIPRDDNLRLGITYTVSESITNGTYIPTSIQVNEESPDTFAYNTSEGLYLASIGNTLTLEDNVQLILTFEFKENIFEENSPYVGDFKGRTISTSGSNAFLRFNRTGIYGYGSSETYLGDQSGTFNVDTEAVGYLTGESKYGSDRFLVEDEGYVFYIESTSSMSSNALLLKGNTENVTINTAQFYEDGSSTTRHLVQFNAGDLTTYAIVDPTNKKLDANLSIEIVSGTPFTSGAVVKVKNSTGEDVTTLKFDRANRVIEVTLDNMQGEYTAATDSANQYGTLVLDGAGTAKFTGENAYSYASFDYTVSGTTITLTNPSSGVSQIIEFTVDTNAKTYSGDNLGMIDLENVGGEGVSSNANYDSPVVTIGENKYVFRFYNYGDGDSRFSYATVGSEGEVGKFTYIGSSSYCGLVADLRGDEVILTLDPTSYVYDRYQNPESVQIKISNGTFVISCTDFGDDNIKFTFDNVTLTKAE